MTRFEVRIFIYFIVEITNNVFIFQKKKKGIKKYKLTNNINKKQLTW